MKPTQMGILVGKLVVTGFLLWFLLREVDLGPVAMRFGNIQEEWVFAAILLLFGQLLLTGVRWYYVGQLVGAGIRIQLATRLILVGQFFNQVLPSSVGGDAVRAWLLSREGISIRHALVSVICDRSAALVMLAVIVACTLPIVLLSGKAEIPSARILTIGIVALTVIGLLFLFLWGNSFSVWLIGLPRVRPLGVLVRDLRLVLLSSRKSLWVIGLSVVVQTMVVMTVYFCALALDIRLGLVHLLMLPLIMLVASIPISFAGWGLRESAMVTGLGFGGIPAPESLAISVCFGIAQVIIGLPGLAVSIHSPRRRSPSVERS